MPPEPPVTQADSLGDVINKLNVMLDSVDRLESVTTELVYGSVPPTQAPVDFTAIDRFNTICVVINEIDRRINRVSERLAERV